MCRETRDGSISEQRHLIHALLAYVSRLDTAKVQDLRKKSDLYQEVGGWYRPSICIYHGVNHLGCSPDCYD